jgi:SAM-dependent methyltransferase
LRPVPDRPLQQIIERHDDEGEAEMTSTHEATAPDLGAVKERQQQAWASGDFHAVAARIVLVAEQLVDSADLHAGWRVLDVATGSGNAAIAAARLGCEAVGIDYVPALVERGRVRAIAEGLAVQLLEGDAESLPFPDASFDAVTSVFGAMFAPDHRQAARELVRVSKPGGTIALASWTPGGFIGELFRTVARHVPPPAGVSSPMLWGTEAHLHELFGDEIASLETTERTFTFRFRSAEEFVDFFRTWYGPTLKAFAALDGAESRDALEADLVSLATRFDRLASADAIAIPATYAETIAVRR